MCSMRNLDFSERQVFAQSRKFPLDLVDSDVE